ncbi:MAG: adenine phosphoribosyltransferase [Nanoarchaeota archaeon]
MDYLKEKIRTIPHWPRQGVMFRDITTLLKDPKGLSQAISHLYDRYKEMNINVVAGIESRGFIHGAILAEKLGVGFVPIRKKGKLPGETLQEEYNLEYGSDALEIHTDAINQGDNVLIVDDLIATAGTSLAAVNLINRLGGNVIECSFIIELPDLKGREKLEQNGIKVFSLIKFEGD